MPGLGGRTIAEILQHEYPGLRVLFMSGYTTDTVVRHGVRQESVSFLQKPFVQSSSSAQSSSLLHLVPRWHAPAWHEPPGPQSPSDAHGLHLLA